MMMISTVDAQPAPVYAAAPAQAAHRTRMRATIYMPSSVALRLLGPVARAEPSAAERRAADAPPAR